MDEKKEHIQLKEIAEKLNLDKSNARKYIINQGFSFIKIRTKETRGQLTLALSMEDFETVLEHRKLQGFLHDDKVGLIIDNNNGFFYIIQLIPDIIPERIKIGFATNIENRLKAHRTTAPTAEIIKYWPSHRDWERTAIASITRTECKNVGGEVYDCEDLKKLIERADLFFDLMPKV